MIPFNDHRMKGSRRERRAVSFENNKMQTWASAHRADQDPFQGDTVKLGVVQIFNLNAMGITRFDSVVSPIRIYVI